MSLRQHNFIYLLAGLLFLLLGMPLFRDLTGSSYLHISELAFSVFLIIGIWSLHGAQRWFLLGIVLIVLGIGGNLLVLAGAGQGFAYLSLTSYIIFLLLTISLATLQVFRSGTVDANSIVGAVCIYLLLGVIWSLVYVFVNLLIPGSFSGEISGSAFQQLHDFLYYSFVTLTTLGYGEITPIRATARALATLEAVLGQFYIATLVAGLVAAYITRTQQTTNGGKQEVLNGLMPRTEPGDAG
jgi:hypothetical protein